MSFVMAPVAREAIDPIAFFILAVIVLNIISSIAKSIRRAATRGDQGDAQARQRLAQTLSPRQAPQAMVDQSAAAATRAAEIARLRQALLASAGVPDQSSATPASVPAILRPALARVAATVAVRMAQPSSLPAPTTATADASGAMAATLSDAWSLESPGGLMTLESAASAFQQLAAPGTPEAAAQMSAALAAAAPQALSILQGPSSGANLFIAAAIVGPSAAFRPIGHTPGGW